MHGILIHNVHAKDSVKVVGIEVSNRSHMKLRAWKPLCELINIATFQVHFMLYVKACEEESGSLTNKMVLMARQYILLLFLTCSSRNLQQNKRTLARKLALDECVVPIKIKKVPQFS